MAQDISGRVAVITGASSGIGAATARALAAEGAHLALLARRADKVTELADELRSDTVKAVAIEGDVTDRASLERAVAQVADDLGGADILVNNAGQMLLAPFTDDQAEETRRMVETNLLGAMTATALFLEQLKDGGGDVINISSVAGRLARKGSSVYNATKWGLNGWSEALRQELLPDVRVVVVEPGAVDTELTHHITHEASQQASQKMYQDVEAISPDDIADIVVFAVTRTRNVSINEVLVRPTKQAY